MACSESGLALPYWFNVLSVTALALALALQVLCLISLCIFAAQVTNLAPLTEFLLLTGRTGLAELPALSPDVEQEMRMPLWKV